LFQPINSGYKITNVEWSGLTQQEVINVINNNVLCTKPREWHITGKDYELKYSISHNKSHSIGYEREINGICIHTYSAKTKNIRIELNYRDNRHYMHIIGECKNFYQQITKIKSVYLPGKHKN
jgi:hypothetical protein